MTEQAKYKYALCPGMVTSKYDGDRHFIDAGRLANLYGVRMADCFVVRSVEDARRAKELDLFFLRPRFHGDYREHIERAGDEQ